MDAGTTGLLVISFLIIVMFISTKIKTKAVPQIIPIEPMTLAYDKLTIPLDNAMGKARKDSKLAITEVVFIAFILFALCIVIIHHLSHDIPLSMRTSPAPAIAGIFGLIFYIATRVINARKFLNLSSGSLPTLLLDSEGVTFPIILLPNLPPFEKVNRKKADLLANNQAYFKIKWEDIESWKVIPRKAGTIVFTENFYFITLKNKENIWIERKFLVGREQEILDFAQKFLPTHIGEVPMIPAKTPWYKPDF